MTDLELPPEVARSLTGFVDAAKSALGADLASIVLFGSAAEGRLRASSDVNRVVVLSRFDPASADRLREPLGLAHAAKKTAGRRRGWLPPRSYAPET